jgi:hypothetical protein
MRVFLFRGAGALAILTSFIAALSCARDQQLVGIEIQPTTQSFGASNIPVPADAGLAVQLRAIGHYIHPPVTKDITSEVTWGSDTPQMVVVNSTGLLTATGGSCGSALVSATRTTNFSAGNRPSTGAIVTATMTANVVCFTGASGNNALLTIIIVGGGTVTAVPPGIVCSFTCTLPYAFGSGPILLTAAPSPGNTFSGWSGCFNVNGPQCTISKPFDADQTVTATFQ